MGKLLTIIASVRTFEYRRHKRPFARVIKDRDEGFSILNMDMHAKVFERKLSREKNLNLI